jgi:D-3-phosphoglycerate dehydrogenase|tara:strand:- start:141 stop:1040 length:900 start_codon:yes stop_codon:yes gene_type:complete
MLKLICPNTNVFDKSITQKYKKYFKCKFYGNLSQSKFNKISNNFDIILLRFSHFLKLKEDSKIKYILSPTTGLNHIDKKIINNSKIKIFHLNNKSFLKKIKASSEFTFYLILATLRKIKNINQKNVIGTELNGKLVGVIGLGRIGNNVANFCSSLKAKVIFYDNFIEKINNKKVKKKSINFLLKNSDLIVICIPSTDKNFKFLNKKRIDLIKKGGILINTSRGEIIDEEYVINLAKKKYLFYSTDVIQNEQFIKKNYYLKMNKNSNLIITSHLAGLTEESIYKTDKEIFKNFLSYYEKN